MSISIGHDPVDSSAQHHDDIKRRHLKRNMLVVLSSCYRSIPVLSALVPESVVCLSVDVCPPS